MVTDGVDDSWKQLAMELLVTIAENAPAMMRKHAEFLPKIGQLLALLFAYITLTIVQDTLSCQCDLILLSPLLLHFHLYFHPPSPPLSSSSSPSPFFSLPGFPSPPLSAVTQALQFMLQVEDDEEWLTSDNTEDDDDGTRWVW